MHLKTYTLYSKPLQALPTTKLLITTLNAHSYNTALSDKEFEEALKESDVLISDGISVVWAMKWLTGQKLNKIAGADLFYYEMERLKQRTKNLDTRQDTQNSKIKNSSPGKVFFLGSSEAVLEKIKTRASIDYPNVEVYTYSPPYKSTFTIEDNTAMVAAVNAIQPDVLFVGMTAPKQEKWAYRHFKELKCGHICCIGAVFDFYAGTVKRAPQWMINIGLEWFYRLIKEPRRMWKRYIIGNTKFIYYILQEKLISK